MPLEDVKEMVKNEVLRDKKAEKILGKLKNCKTLAQMKGVAGVQVDTAKNVNFYSQMYDPAILGTVTGAKANQFVGPMKGYNAVFAYQVLDVKKQAGAKYDEQQYVMSAARNHATMALSPRQYYGESPFLTYLKNKAQVEDFRYRFY